MGHKMYKRIRQAMKKAGKWPVENDYRVKKVQKMVYSKDPVTGEIKAQTVTRQIIFNVAKQEYKKIKKLYNEGKLKV